MTIFLPDPITAHFAVDRAWRSEVAACFTPDAVVTDENRAYRGRAEIERWKTEASSRYANLVITPTDIVERDGRAVVTANVSGDFASSPADLRVALVLAADGIATLEIGA